MPRSGGGIYSKGSPSAVSGTTIQSAAYNTTIDDLVTDANAARPVSAGGTGAANAADARTNLGVAALAGATFTGAISGTTGTFSGVVEGANASAGGHLLNRTTADARFVRFDASTSLTASQQAQARSNMGLTNRAYAEYLLAQNLAVIIPYDDTIPQSSEGTQILSVSLTPSSTTARVQVRFQGSGATSVVAAWTAALFTGGSGAVASNFTYCSTATVPASCVLEYEFVPGSTSPITFTVRVGADRTANLTFNGTPGTPTRVFGGVNRGATLVVEELP